MLIMEILEVEQHPDQGLVATSSVFPIHQHIGYAFLSSQRFSIETFLVHFRISDKSVLQCWSMFSYFMHRKIQPVISQLLILEPRS